MKKQSFLILFLLLISHIFAQKTILHCGRLIDGISDEIKTEMSIIVDGNKIIAVLNGYAKAGNGDTIIDLKDKTVMPGLMDMHVHIEHQLSPKRYLEKYTLNEADIAYNAAVFAKITLLAGFTTVRDLGGTGVNISLRNAINQGKAVGPRIYTSGKSIATTGGHADPTNGRKKSLMGDPGPAEGVINGPAEAAKAVRQRYKNGADLIKITATGGVLSEAKNGLNPQFTEEELKAIIATANDYDMITAAHAHGAEGMKRAVEAGINSIEHGTFMTNEIMELMIEKGTYYVPTITAGKEVAEKAEIEGYYPEIIRPKARMVGPQIQKTFEKAYKKGVKIAFGTDAGVYPHGENALEFAYMVEGGMPAMEAIQSATIIAAQLLRVDDVLGSIETGKLADIIAVDGNPIEDITTMQKIVFVMKDGIVYLQK
jgi:imidazolonepropionase-like amidohydrolase